MKASIIIPTYGRPNDVVGRTLRSLIELQDEFINNIIEIVVIDQNRVQLDLDSELQACSEYKTDKIKLIKYCKNCDEGKVFSSNLPYIPIYHIVGLPPSTTIAKNYGIKKSQGDLIIFFDDDIEAHKGVIHSHIKFQKITPQIGMLGGREIVSSPAIARRSRLKETLSKVANLFFDNKKENNYKFNGEYIGRIHPLSFFFCKFDQVTDYLIPVNTIRGCNASCRRVVFDAVYGFDEAFQGSALREESDFSLRIEKSGFKNYYFGGATVTHHRQLGGCNNLATSVQSFISKLDNELLFQKKHFSHISKWYFFLRLLPFAIDNIKNTFGLSFFFLLRQSLSLNNSGSVHPRS